MHCDIATHAECAKTNKKLAYYWFEVHTTPYGVFIGGIGLVD